MLIVKVNCFGHVPRELSRYAWLSIGEEAIFEAEVHKEKAMVSPLVQCGLEILIKALVTWDESEKLSILVTKVKEVEYLTGEHADELKNILEELGIEEDEDNDDDMEFQTETVDNAEIRMLQKYF